MSNNGNTPLRLAFCAGSKTDTALTPWEGDFNSLAELLSKPVVGPKGGSYFVRAQGTRRTNDGIAQVGNVILDGDSRIDPDSGEILAGAPDPALVHAELARLGVAHIIYSSHSNGKTEGEVDAENAAKRARLEKQNAAEAAKAAAAGKPFKPTDIDSKMINTGGAYGPDLHKWRCIVPAAVARADLEHTVAWLVGQLHAAGVMLADVKENHAWSQPWYLPRVPDEARRALFKFYTHDTGQLWSGVPAGELPAKQPKQPKPEQSDPEQPKQSAPEQSKQPEQPEQPEQFKPVDRPKAIEVPGWESPIAAFNKTFSCHDVLLTAGYTSPAHGGTDGPWLRPGSESGSPGVKLVPGLTKEHGRQYVFSHGSDALNDEFAHDAFDCYRLLECDGEMAEALRWNAELTAANQAALAAADPNLVAVERAVDELDRKVLADPIKTFSTPEMLEGMATLSEQNFQRWIEVQAALKTGCTGKSTLITQIVNKVKAIVTARKHAAATAMAVKQQSEATGMAAYTYGKTVTPGFGVVRGKDGSYSPVAQSDLARLCLPYLAGLLAYDHNLSVWYQFIGTHWAMLTGKHGPAPVFQNLLNLAFAGTPEGFNIHMRNGVIALVEGSGNAPCPKFSNDVLPFLNGVLQLKGKVWHPTTTPASAQDWVLPYAYDRNADCPVTKAWLLKAMCNDLEMVEFLRCAFAAALRGKWGQAQKFLNLCGAAGSGKGTLARLLMLMLGEGNIFHTTMQDLEMDKFEAQFAKGKRLAVIADLEDWRGKTDRLHAMTGGDRIPFRKKFENASGEAGFEFDGMVLISSNRPLKTTNLSGALPRRRLTVPFERAFSTEEKTAWFAEGGEQQLRNELPGFVNWLLGVPEDDVLAALANPPATVVLANEEANEASNTVTAWLVERCKPARDCQTLVGKGERISWQENSPGANPIKVTRQGWRNSDIWLYPNYREWCDTHGIMRAETHITFAKTISDTMKQFGVIEGVGDKHKTKIGKAIANIALRTDDDTDEFNYFLVPKWLR